MEDIFEQISGFSFDSSYLFWGGLLSVFVIILAIITVSATQKKVSSNDDFDESDALIVWIRLIVFIVIIAYFTTV